MDAEEQRLGRFGIGEVEQILGLGGMFPQEALALEPLQAEIVDHRIGRRIEQSHPVDVMGGLDLVFGFVEHGVIGRLGAARTVGIAELGDLLHRRHRLGDRQRRRALDQRGVLAALAVFGKGRHDRRVARYARHALERVLGEKHRRAVALQMGADIERRVFLEREQTGREVDLATGDRGIEPVALIVGHLAGGALQEIEDQHPVQIAELAEQPGLAHPRQRHLRHLQQVAAVQMARAAAFDHRRRHASGQIVGQLREAVLWDLRRRRRRIDGSGGRGDGGRLGERLRLRLGL